MAAGGLVAVTLFWPITYSADESDTVTIKIQHGTPFLKIASMLTDSGVVRGQKGFVFTAKLFGKSNQLKAGKYVIERESSNYKVLTILCEGKQAAEWVTIPEGVDSRRIAGILQKRLEVDSARFVQLVRDSTVARNYAIEAVTLEGYLYPDTYKFTWGLDEKQLLDSMIRQFRNQVPDSLYDRAEELGFSFNEILTLASIIEGEAMLDSERCIISAVYHNRLRRGMLLQADPTIQYIIPDGPRRLLRKDLQIDSPYNTYMHPGLPPGPISNPGTKSIIAALYPVEKNFLYFVATGAGGHIFSSTLRQHIRAKKDFDQVRRKVARQEKGNTKRQGN